ncbi:uncharacterized protein BYT42DRAFT_482758, partial [Radiomyces spectabilis]|uniref:uncharacterized protein n=1 Tax=Radiomyces spectabilis TaxID=64574 RepID=UPI00222042AE
ETVARTFATNSETHGFRYVYIPSKFRMKTKELRSRLRILGFNNSRILDVHYPDRQIVALLIHNDYYDELTTLLAKHTIQQIKDFNPRDPMRLRDPKFETLAAKDRQQQADQLHVERLERAINFIRAPVKFAVARSFHQQQWLSDSHLQSILSRTELTTTPPDNPFLTNDDDTNV